MLIYSEPMTIAGLATEDWDDHMLKCYDYGV